MTTLLPALAGLPGRQLRRLLVLGLVLAVTALVVPTPTYRDAPVSLVKGQGASGVDHNHNVVWILFLGSDARPGQGMTRSRADAIQLTGVNLKTGHATMIGIPRDSYVPIPGHGRDKINAAMYFGGPKLMGRAVGNLVGVQPDYVFTTGFAGFRKMVNTIGGVTVNSRFAFSDPVRPKGYKVGKNHLTGFQAEIFARIRKSFPRGDFDRSGNQQDVMRGILAQVRGGMDKPGFMERGVLSVVRNMNTDLKPSQLYKLAQAGTRVEQRKLRGCVVLGGIGTVNGASVVFPSYSQARRIGRDVRNDARLDHGC
ncbi:LCP family protein [Nocardioides iriomotensis]|uniref:LytR family transcriptional regulator n=1 Tax=Nocardioides iriomotensis TaxID=715784 RepID=A0A4Q5IVG8_9ACTN|nr:LCP family protein [Nocardioides iriomotensis]RYU10017.1 LytR family transcriptional regulator [Nocardioides iriomotensis]